MDNQTAIALLDAAAVVDETVEIRDVGWVTAYNDGERAYSLQFSSRRFYLTRNDVWYEYRAGQWHNVGQNYVFEKEEDT